MNTDGADPFLEVQLSSSQPFPGDIIQVAVNSAEPGLWDFVINASDGR